MLSCFRSAAARSALAALFVVYLGACTVNQHIELSANPKLAEVAGLTTKSGKDVTFDPRGAVVSNNMLYAVGPQGQVVFPVDSIKTVWVKQFSPSHTLGLVGAIALVLVAYFAISNKATGYCNPCG
jgi:hypothetical protein